MNISDTIENILSSENIKVVGREQPYQDESIITVESGDFPKACHSIHKLLDSPVMMFFAEDMRLRRKCYRLNCVFLDVDDRCWVIIAQDVAQGEPAFKSIAKDIYSASLFEREIKEMFGIEPIGNPDLRSLRLHDEVWPGGQFPLRKDFSGAWEGGGIGPYSFKRVEGEGIFEIPVGPVHAGVIGPGHFRFSVAGEPIINLETRLGWTHRGIEKLLEGKTLQEAVRISECISGDTAFGYSSAFCHSVEKVLGVDVPARAMILRAMCLELERLYNHANDIGGMALDVGFSYPAQFASLIKEAVLRLNGELTGSRYLKGVNVVGGVAIDIDEARRTLIENALLKIAKDFLALEEMLFSSVSFMDRVDATGILRTKTARDLGITGLALRASGIGRDLRKIFPRSYAGLSFEVARELKGDVAARLKVRCKEARESIRLIRQCLEKLRASDPKLRSDVSAKEGCALGYAEAWRGPVLIWTRVNAEGRIERCKITDPSFHNWEALTFAVLGNIVPDFPLCNKSFDLSYSGNDL